MARKILALCTLLLALPVSAQSKRRAVGRAPAPAQRITVSDDFRNGRLGWEAGFADYSPLSEGMELDAGIFPLPPELGTSGTGFMVHGNNHSDDLFSFLAKKLTRADGVQPNQRYSVSFGVLLASNAGGDQCLGVGGAPGLGVLLKVGAIGREPRVDLDSTGH
jgi:hypothetical protein